MTPSTLRSLAEQVEAAEKGSRELDEAIFLALVIDPLGIDYGVKGRAELATEAGCYTTSLDAIAALEKEVLPDLTWCSIKSMGGVLWETGSFTDRLAAGKGNCKDECRSRCAALLRAKAEQVEQEMAA